MKKLLVLLGILAAFSFVACNKEAGGSDPETNIENEDTGDNGAVEDEGTTGGDSTEDEGSTGGDSTEDEPEAPSFDGKIDLTGKVVKNADAFAGAWKGGFQIDFDAVDVSEYKAIKVDCVCYDADNAVIPANWGNGQYIVLKNVEGDWKARELFTQYNIGMFDSEGTQQKNLDGKEGIVTGIAVQSASDAVKYIEVTSIEFVK